MKPRFSEAPIITRINELEQRLEKAEKLRMKEHDGKKVPHFAADGKGEGDLAKGQEHEEKIISCLKKKGGAASLKECADACGISTEECKKVIAGMDNVQTSKYGDIVLTDGMSDEELEKAGCMPSHKMEKAQPNYATEKITDINPGFRHESGGQTRNAYFTTNQTVPEIEDAPKPVKKQGESINLEFMGQALNTHDGSGQQRSDFLGENKPLDLTKAPASAMRERMESGLPVICGACGATPDTGCLMAEHRGIDLSACPSFQPMMG